LHPWYGRRTDCLIATQERIVGELLQPAGQACLNRMGLGDTTEASKVDSIRVDGYVCITPNTDAGSDLVLTYPDAFPVSSNEFLGYVSGKSAVAESGSRPNEGGAKYGKVAMGTGEGDLPRGRSFWNHLFVLELRKSAKGEKLVDYRNGSVRELFMADDDEFFPGREDNTCRGVVYVPEGEEKPVAVRARLVVFADGMFSIMRKKMDAGTPRPSSTFVGYLLDHKADEPCLPYPNRGHVILADPDPVLLYQITPTQTRILVDVPGLAPMDDEEWVKKYMLERVKDQLPTGVRAVFEKAVLTQEPMACVNKRLPARPSPVRRAILLGDAWNMRHPLTGGGMTVALRDVETLAMALDEVDIDRDDLLTTALDRFQEARRHHAATTNVLANALHRVFTKPDSDDGTREALREACVEYLKMGGAPTAGPVGLLSGLSPKPLVLVSHFFLVALHAVRNIILPCPHPMSFLKAWRLMQVACIIIMPLAVAENVAVLSWTPVQGLVDFIFPWSHIDPDKMS
jgi:squalene monooxygenase